MIDLAKIEKLHGKSVLVKSSRDSRTPAIALRGSLQVENTTGRRDGTQVKVALDYPEMFTSPAHQLVIPLDVSEVSRLLSSGADEPYEITLAVDLDKEARDQSVVAPRATQPR